MAVCSAIDETERAIGAATLSVHGRMDLSAMQVMQDTLLDLAVLKQRLPLDQHYTTEFVPVKI
jgi:hypothetical protein